MQKIQKELDNKLFALIVKELEAIKSTEEMQVVTSTILTNITKSLVLIANMCEDPHFVLECMLNEIKKHSVTALSDKMKARVYTHLKDLDNVCKK